MLSPVEDPEPVQCTRHRQVAAKHTDQHFTDEAYASRVAPLPMRLPSMTGE